MKIATLIFTGLAILAGLIALAKMASPVIGALFFVPFAMGPLLVTLLLSCYFERNVSQLLLLISSAAYSAWFFYVYLDAFHWNLDPQSAIAMVFVGLYALPVMLLFWVPAFVMRKRPS